MRRLLPIILALFLLTGCLPVKVAKELQLRQDGSGTMVLDVSSDLKAWAEYLRQKEPSFRNQDARQIVVQTTRYLDAQAEVLEKAFLGKPEVLPRHLRKRHYNVGDQRHWVLELDFAKREDAERKVRGLIANALRAPEPKAGAQQEGRLEAWLKEPDPFLIRWELQRSQDRLTYRSQLAALAIGQSYRVRFDGKLLEVDGKAPPSDGLASWQGGLLPRQLQAVWKVGSGVAKRRDPVDVGLELAKARKPYRWAAAGPNEFDCSGFTRWCFREAGWADLPRVTKSQATVGSEVSPREIQRGDLLFFATDPEQPGEVTHVAIAINAERFVHAEWNAAARDTPSAALGDYVRERILKEATWATLLTVRRIAPPR